MTNTAVVVVLPINIPVALTVVIDDFAAAVPVTFAKLDFSVGTNSVYLGVI